MSPGFALRIVSIAWNAVQPGEVGRLADDPHVELGVDRRPEPRVHEREVEDREQHAELVAAGGGPVTGHWHLSSRGHTSFRV